MDAKEFQRLMEQVRDDILTEVNDRLPRKVGVIAVNHFRQNFRDGGWRDDGLHPWKKTRRQLGDGTEAQYGPLTSRRNHLMSSIQSRPGRATVTIVNPLPYAAIHNDGGDFTTHPAVTPRMRRFAWAKAYSIAGTKGRLPKDMPREAAMWKALALTRKQRLTIKANMPQRRFMGDSAELRDKITKAINQSLEKTIYGTSAL